jgi:hypothetical protein
MGRKAFAPTYRQPPNSAIAPEAAAHRQDWADFERQERLKRWLDLSVRRR